ncbi:MAG TPA: hypothetical protein VGR73_02860 [Bryobacteraceae bacterium]|nr:hypothetical protein [Bryobacteraceae bacterium]
MRWPERASPILAVLCLMSLILVNGRPYFTNASRPPRGILDPHVALQMARSVQEVDAILSDAPSPDREAMRVKQYIDFAFIATYAGLFVVISWALARMNRWGWLIGIFSVLAAFHDVKENLDILGILDRPLNGTTQGMISHLHLMSVGKWGFAAAAIMALGVFAWRSRRWYLKLIAGVDLAAAALILGGLVDNAWLVWAGLALAAGAIGNAVTLKFLVADIASR